MLIDSHAHLYLNQFNDDYSQVIQRSIDQGVKKIFLPNIDSSTVNDLARLCNIYPNSCYPMIGLHPCYVKENWEDELARLRPYFDQKISIFDKKKIWAVGEIGLDFYWDTSYKDEQKKALRRQIEWSIELNLPIVLHTRNSILDTVDIVSEFQGTSVRGIFHCFSGTLEEAKYILELPNFYLGIGGVLTFKNSGLDAVVKDLPLEYLVLETDAPYLAPAPYRGKRNESAYIALIAQKLADIKSLSIAEVAKVTSDNCAKIFEF